MSEQTLQTQADVPSHRYSTPEKLQSALESFRMRLLSRKVLLAGPYTGEFGWELMQWQGYVRARRPFYDAVHVITYPGRDYLYEGCQVHAHDVSLARAGYGYGKLSPSEANTWAHRQASQLGLRHYDVFTPAHLCTQYHKRLFWSQDFRLLREPPLPPSIRDVAFHFRAVQKEGPDNLKNYRTDLADELAQRCLAEGLSLICVGHPSFSYCARGCEDHRSVELRQTVVAMNSVRLVGGENSGPMHLANLCGQPTLIWANDQWRIDYSLRWNPFRVPIYVAANNSHQPEPSVVLSAILSALADLKNRTKDHTRPVFSQPAQPIAYF